MPPGHTFTAKDALTTTRTMHAALGIAPEQFPTAAFVGIVSDEIKQLRAAGKNPGRIGR